MEMRLHSFANLLYSKKDMVEPAQPFKHLFAISLLK